MHTNFLDTENDDNSLQIQEERENETAEDPMTEFFEMEDNENTVEVTGLEEITMPEVVRICWLSVAMMKMMIKNCNL